MLSHSVASRTQAELQGSEADNLIPAVARLTFERTVDVYKFSFSERVDQHRTRGLLNKLRIGSSTA
jgi:hypothetical protein